MFLQKDAENNMGRTGEKMRSFIENTNKNDTYTQHQKETVDISMAANKKRELRKLEGGVKCRRDRGKISA